MTVELFLSDRWSMCEFWFYICIFFLFCLLKRKEQNSVFDNVMLTSPDVSDKFKFSPTLLSYVLPPLASFLAAPEIGKISAQLHTTVKQICFPSGNVLFLSLFSLYKN